MPNYKQVILLRLTEARAIKDMAGSHGRLATRTRLQIAWRLHRQHLGDEIWSPCTRYGAMRRVGSWRCASLINVDVQPSAAAIGQAFEGDL